MSFADELRKVLQGKSEEKPKEEEDILQKITLITQEGCRGCSLAKEYLKEEIESGKIKVCDLNKDSTCKKIADDLHLAETPSIVIKDNEGKFHKCQIRTEGDDFVYECPLTEQVTGEQEVPKTAPPPKHGKIAISCMSSELKNQLGWQLQNQPNVSPEILAMVGSLPECSDAEDGMPIPIGFSEIKKSGTKHKTTSGRGNFMRSCLSGSTGEPQPLRMKRCAQQWREMDEKEKKKWE